MRDACLPLNQTQPKNELKFYLNTNPELNYKVAPEQKSVERKLYNFDQLEDIAAGSKDFLPSLAKIYVNVVTSDSNVMVDAARVRNWEKVSKLAHKLKATIDSMNIRDIATDIRTLEVDAKNRANTDTLCGTAVRVNDVIQMVAKQLKTEFSL